MRLGRPLALLVAGGAAAGCYRYEPVATPAPEPGTFVAVTLTDQASRARVGALGSDIAVVRGHLVSQDSTAIRVSVVSVVSTRGIESTWRGEQVELGMGDVASIQRRRFSAGRSALLAGVSLSGIVVSGAAFGLIGGGGSGGGTGSPPKH
ncbi:MAG TPA: hypothetical protein VKB45_13725 [Gemmatimonadales bacterium]|nr:hypothetical protein [Gemmatimonadales bacterium]